MPIGSRVTKFDFVFFSTIHFKRMLCASDECFLCLSNEVPLHRVCNCNTVVHQACFTKLLAVPSHMTHCAVCQSKYETIVDCDYKVDCAFWYCAVLSMYLVAFFVGMTGILTCGDAYPSVACDYCPILFVFSVCALWACKRTIQVRLEKTGSCCCVTYTQNICYRMPETQTISTA